MELGDRQPEVDPSTSKSQAPAARGPQAASPPLLLTGLPRGLGLPAREAVGAGCMPRCIGMDGQASPRDRRAWPVVRIRLWLPWDSVVEYVGGHHLATLATGGSPHQVCQGQVLWLVTVAVM